MSERQADTICFACREKGHAAKDCPSSRLSDTLGDEAGRKVAPGVGICYRYGILFSARFSDIPMTLRCGSTRHTLSRCKKPTNPSDPLPFAACFLCSGKGHLASSCPQNKTRGIYPNGGSCKLCGDITHLAKNCSLMKSGHYSNYYRVDCTTLIAWSIDTNGNNGSMLISPAVETSAGADEDDFHTLKRRTAQIEKDERKEEEAKRMMAMKVGAHSGVVKAFGKPPLASTKKVVYF